MGKNTDRCPLCGKKMKAMGGSMVCGECCYVMSGTHVDEQQSYVQQPHMQQPHVQQPRPVYPVQQRPAYPVRRKKGSGAMVMLVVVAVAMVIAIAAVLLVAFVRVQRDNPYDYIIDNFDDYEFDMSYDDESKSEMIYP